MIDKTSFNLSYIRMNALLEERDKSRKYRQ